MEQYGLPWVLGMLVVHPNARVWLAWFVCLLWDAGMSKNTNACTLDGTVMEHHVALILHSDGSGDFCK